MVKWADKGKDRPALGLASTGEQPDPDDLTSSNKDDRTSISGSEGFILAILSAAKSHIDQMQIALVMYSDCRLPEICKEFEVKLDDLLSSLSMVQHEVKAVKTRLKAASSHSQHRKEALYPLWELWQGSDMANRRWLETSTATSTVTTLSSFESVWMASNPSWVI